MHNQKVQSGIKQINIYVLLVTAGQYKKERKQGVYNLHRGVRNPPHPQEQMGEEAKADEARPGSSTVRSPEWEYPSAL